MCSKEPAQQYAETYPVARSDSPAANQSERKASVLFNGTVVDEQGNGRAVCSTANTNW
jgi:hypothetical protein